MQSQNISQGFDRMAGWRKEQERILEQNVLKTRRSKIMDWWWLIQSVRSHDNLMEAVWKSDWNNHMSDISRFFFGRNLFDALANQNACIGGDEGRSRFFRSWSKHDHPISKWRMASLNTLLKTEVWRRQIQNQPMWILNGGFWPMVDSDQWWTNGGFWN